MNSNVTKIAPKLHFTREHIWSFKCDKNCS